MTQPSESNLLLLRSASARKVGTRSTGSIQYVLLCDSAHESLYIRIACNEGGGYFSKEIVPFTRAKECVSGFSPDRAIPSKVFAPAFIGRSSNNAGFLAAILRAEELLAAAPGTDFQHVVTGDWNEWEATALKLDGTPIPAVEAPIGSDDGAQSENASNDRPEHTEHTKPEKGRKAPRSGGSR
ncbi:hypothetical protein [Paraburkholderia bryophila]|uniref:Uncharacterized protein n=1 Tax=Paraburkholderia bryophila TaxID=420952 RepID=A0A7Y9WKB2_9BURK|nr:hypothetical protein [Paraburkholderia bryophila]NYH22467.1 hypothetical protein [Paraburkholderia bryophila]